MEDKELTDFETSCLILHFRELSVRDKVFTLAKIKYGSSFTSEYKHIAKELGLTVDQVTKMFSHCMKRLQVKRLTRSSYE